MKMTENKKEKGKVSISIEGDLTINSVMEIKTGLSDYFTDIKNIDFDLSSVDKIDTAGFQLLLMLRKETQAKNKILNIINPSDDVKRIFNLYGEIF